MGQVQDSNHTKRTEARNLPITRGNPHKQHTIICPRQRAIRIQESVCSVRNQTHPASSGWRSMVLRRQSSIETRFCSQLTRDSDKNTAQNSHSTYFLMTLAATLTRMINEEGLILLRSEFRPRSTTLIRNRTFASAQLVV